MHQSPQIKIPESSGFVNACLRSIDVLPNNDYYATHSMKPGARQSSIDLQYNSMYIYSEVGSNLNQFRLAYLLVVVWEDWCMPVHSPNSQKWIRTCTACTDQNLHKIISAQKDRTAPLSLSRARDGGAAEK